MLRDQLRPVALRRRGKVDVDEAVTGGFQIGLEREHRALVGDVLVLGVKVVDELHPWQKSWILQSGTRANLERVTTWIE